MVGVGAFLFLARRADAADACDRLIEVTVQQGDTCAAIATRLYKDSARVDLIHEHNPMGPPPHALVAGTKLKVPPCVPKAVTTPPAAAQGPDARLTWWRNKVDLLTPQPAPASRDAPLARGNKVLTAERSSAEVTFRDESMLFLGERTMVIVLGATHAQNARIEPSETTLVSGALRSKLGALAGRPTVKTDSASVALAPESQVSVDDKKTTRLAVYKGEGSITAQKKTEKVPTAFGSKAEAGKAPTKPAPLPAAPLWKIALRPTILTAADSATLRAEYERGATGPAPATWRVAVARDADFHELVVDKVVPASVTELEVERATDGTYHVRVSAIDADGFEGPYTEASSARVATHVGARPADGAWTQDVPLGGLGGLWCAEGSAPAAKAESIVLDRFKRHVLRCAAAQDLAGASEIVIPAEPVHAELSLFAEGKGAGRVRVTVDDQHAHSVARADVAVRATGAEVGAFAPDGKGAWEAPVRWSAGAAQASFAVVVNEAVAPAIAIALPSAAGTVVKAAAPASDAQDEATTRSWRFDFALAGGVAAAHGEPGPTAIAQAGPRWSFGSIDVGVGLRAGYEVFEHELAGASPTVPPIPASPSFQVSQRAVVLGLPLRLDTKVGPVRLGAQLMPLVTIDDAISSTPRVSVGLGTRALGGLEVDATARLPLGPGAILLEAGWRQTSSEGRAALDATNSGPRVVLGWAFAF